MSRADDQYDMNEWPGSRSQHFAKIMIVEFNTGGANYIPVQQGSPRPTAAATGGAAGTEASVSFSTQTLQDALKQSGQARPEKVAQASALLSEGNYPSDADLNRLAGFLANRL
jgi:hypothetical protein